MNTSIRFLLTDHGPALRRWARVAAAVVALLITMAWIAGECAFDLGRQLRLALEARNDQLAAAWLQVLGIAREEATAPAPAKPSPQPARPARRRRPRAQHRATAALA